MTETLSQPSSIGRPVRYLACAVVLFAVSGPVLTAATSGSLQVRQLQRQANAFRQHISEIERSSKELRLRLQNISEADVQKKEVEIERSLYDAAIEDAKRDLRALKNKVARLSYRGLAAQLALEAAEDRKLQEDVDKKTQSESGRSDLQRLQQKNAAITLGRTAGERAAREARAIAERLVSGPGAVAKTSGQTSLALTSTIVRAAIGLIVVGNDALEEAVTEGGSESNGGDSACPPGQVFFVVACVDAAYLEQLYQAWLAQAQESVDEAAEEIDSCTAGVNADLDACTQTAATGEALEACYEQWIGGVAACIGDAL